MYSSSLFGLPIKVVKSSLCDVVVPVKRHKWRRNQSAAYHRRIQKKWAKRYGERIEQRAYFLSPKAAGLYGLPDMLAMSPQAFGMLRNFTLP